MVSMKSVLLDLYRPVSTWMNDRYTQGRKTLWAAENVMILSVGCK
jgi:hypothetical protein